MQRFTILEHLESNSRTKIEDWPESYIRLTMRSADRLGKSCEITRFKRLGEISPQEFKQFIGKEMRLSQVEYAPKAEASGILSFYMGKNTPERKDYIMENLVVPVEE